jgi:hypothetical protein
MRYEKIILLAGMIATLSVFGACSHGGAISGNLGTGESESEIATASECNPTQASTQVPCDACMRVINEDVSIAGRVSYTRLAQSDFLNAIGFGELNDKVKEFMPYANPASDLQNVCFGVKFKDVSTIGDEDFPLKSFIGVLEGVLPEELNLKAFIEEKSGKTIDEVKPGIYLVSKNSSGTAMVYAAEKGGMAFVGSMDMIEYAMNAVDTMEDKCPLQGIYTGLADVAIKVVAGEEINLTDKAQTEALKVFNVVPDGFRSSFALDLSDEQVYLSTRAYKGLGMPGVTDEPFLDVLFKFKWADLDLKTDDLLKKLSEAAKDAVDNIDGKHCKDMNREDLIGSFGALDGAPECELISYFRSADYDDIDSIYMMSPEQVSHYVTMREFLDGTPQEAIDAIEAGDLSRFALDGLRSTLSSGDEAKCMMEYHKDCGDCDSWCDEFEAEFSRNAIVNDAVSDGNDDMCKQDCIDVFMEGAEASGMETSVAEEEAEDRCGHLPDCD